MDVATSNRLSAIDAEMHSAVADERIRTSAANIRNLELRLEVLRKEQLELISEAVSRLSHSVTDRED
ncbi:hypothetical protein Lal_00003729 [Lupinus albus]|nr:hypothetical protein Lal_00003729 [Lupinus albus]